MITEDDEEYTAVADALAALDPDLDLDVPLDRVLARGTRLRRTRRTLLGAGAAGTLAVAAALAVAIPSNAGPGRPVVDVQMAGWSVKTNADSSVTLTIQELKDPAQLRQVLAQAGISAYLNSTSGVPFTGCTVPANVHLLPGSDAIQPPHIDAHNTVVVTVDPTAMPTGSVLGLFIDTTTVQPLSPLSATEPTGSAVTKIGPSPVQPTSAKAQAAIGVEAALFSGQPSPTTCLPVSADTLFAVIAPAPAAGSTGPTFRFARPAPGATASR